MSSLCIVGIVLFGAPEGISKYVSTVINQRDKRTEMTLCFSFASTQSRVSIHKNTVAGVCSVSSYRPASAYIY